MGKFERIGQCMKPLPRSFYNKNTVQAARKLLGKVLVRKTGGKILAGKIVETEAYLPQNDPACHAARGKTPRNEPMFGKPGCAYVYFTYGNHFILNAVTEPEGTPAAVLIRALEPLRGIEEMAKKRNINLKKEKNGYKNLTSGPGKLAQAFGITRKENRMDLTLPSSPLQICNGEHIPPSKIVVKTRIGIQAGSGMPLRFYVRDNGFVSRK